MVENGNFVGCILRFWPIFKNLKIFENGSKICARSAYFWRKIGFFNLGKIGYFWSKNDQNRSFWAQNGHFAWLMVRGIFDHFWKNWPLHRHTKFKKSVKKSIFGILPKIGFFELF